MGEIFRDPAALAARIANDREAGRRIAMTNGVFDLLHVGHLRSFTHARSLADRLLVAVNTDRSVRENKGPKRPITPELERGELLAALSCVDYVTFFDEPTVGGLIDLIQPEVYCKGTDYCPETIPETPVVRAYGGTIAIVGDPKDHSSTGLIDRILRAYGP